MNDFIRLSCPSCGGKLEVSHTINQFACAHCGTEHVVNRGGGIISLQPLTEGLQRIQRGTDRTAAELALQRLRGERSELQAVQTEVKEQIEMIAGELIELERLGKQARRSASQARRDGAIVLVVSALSVLAAFFISELRGFCLIATLVFLVIGITKLAESRNPRAGNQSRTELRKITEWMQQLEQSLAVSQKQLDAVEVKLRQIDQEIETHRAQVSRG